jgi:hypothetical protein
VTVVIGRGGTGTNSAGAECPICYATGNGGHGGGCPNMDKRPEEYAGPEVLPAGWWQPPRIVPPGR